MDPTGTRLNTVTECSDVKCGQCGELVTHVITTYVGDDPVVVADYLTVPCAHHPSTLGIGAGMVPA